MLERCAEVRDCLRGLQYDTSYHMSNNKPFSRLVGRAAREKERHDEHVEALDARPCQIGNSYVPCQLHTAMDDVAGGPFSPETQASLYTTQYGGESADAAAGPWMAGAAVPFHGAPLTVGGGTNDGLPNMCLSVRFAGAGATPVSPVSAAAMATSVERRRESMAQRAELGWTGGGRANATPAYVKRAVVPFIRIVGGNSGAHPLVRVQSVDLHRRRRFRTSRLCCRAADGRKIRSKILFLREYTSCVCHALLRAEKLPQ
jgi:hypothetical protein